MADIQIILVNSNNGAYYAGDTIKGTVDLTLDKEKIVNGLYLKFTGTATSYWVRNRTPHYGQEYYFYEKTYLFGDKESIFIPMPAGSHRYNFEFKLPPNLPASVNMQHDNKYGKNKYYVDACLDIPFAFVKEFKQEFFVHRKDDYNDIQYLKVPRSCCDAINSGIFFNCTEAQIEVQITIPYSVFTPGSTIPAKIYISNPCTQNVDKIEIILWKVVTITNYNAGDTTILKDTSKYDVVKNTVEGVRPNSSKTIETALRIPSDIETSESKYCKVIQISYAVAVKTSSGSVEIPVTISRVPLNFNETSSFVSEEPSAPSSSDFPEGYQNSVHNPDAPPTFEEALHMEKPLLPQE